MVNRTQEEIMQNWGVDNSDAPLVSIKCMAFNHENYIAQALDGFLMQETNFPFEILVHDDASTDKTAEIIRKYENAFPKIIKPFYETENQFSKGNGAHHKQINAAIKGRYIALCEGDDYWIDPLKLQKQYDFLNEHSDYSMCFHQAKIVYENGYEKCGLKCDDIENREYGIAEFLKAWIVPTASILSKTECMNYPIKGRERVLNGDIFWILKCSAFGKIYGMRDCMSVYRVHEGGVTYNLKAQNNRTMKYPEHFKCILENFPQAAPDEVKKKLSESYYYRARIQKSMKTTLEDYIKSFAMSRKVFFCMLGKGVAIRVKGAVRFCFPKLYKKMKEHNGRS